MTEETLGLRLRISSRTISYIERGRTNPTAELVVRWCVETLVDAGRLLSAAYGYSPPSSIEEIEIDVEMVAKLLPQRPSWRRHLARWAHAQHKVASTSYLTLNRDDLKQLATDWPISVDELLITLCDFIPLRRS